MCLNSGPLLSYEHFYLTFSRHKRKSVFFFAFASKESFIFVMVEIGQGEVRHWSSLNQQKSCGNPILEAGNHLPAGHLINWAPSVPSRADATLEANYAHARGVTICQLWLMRASHQTSMLGLGFKFAIVMLTDWSMLDTPDQYYLQKGGNNTTARH